MSEPIPDVQARLRTGLADRYSLERALGQGGMATVYLAHDLKHDRSVAVKVLRQDVAATLGAERFLREIRLAAKLSHPHILPLYDSGEAEGLLYFVMPNVEGASLRERLGAESRLPPRVQSIMEIVMNGRDLETLSIATQAAINAARQTPGLVKITAGNYGGRLGKSFIHLV